MASRSLEHPLDPRVSRKDAARLCKYGIEKDVERSDLAVANNDDIQSGVVWGLAFRARAPCQNSPVIPVVRIRIMDLTRNRAMVLN